jgi:hypothetical protein
MKTIGLLFSLTLLFCTQQSPIQKTYRSDQFRPGVISEYIQMNFTKNQDSLISGEYWSVYRDNSFETQETPKQAIELKNISFYQGEEEGIKGELRLPQDEMWFAFRMAEGIFEIDYGQDNIQTFLLEE